MVTKQVFVQLTLAGLLSVTAAALARGQQSIDELPSDLRKAVFEATYAVRHAGGEAVYPVFIDPWIATEEAKLRRPLRHFHRRSGDTAVVGAPVTTTRAPSLRARPTCSCAAGRPGASSRSSPPATRRADDRSASRSPYRATRSWSGPTADDTTGGGNAGSAYVFVRSGTTWSEQAKLTASDAADDDSFGYSVAVSGDTAVVGALLRPCGTG